MKISERVTKIQDDIVDIKITMARNTDALEEHIKRTALAEQNIDKIMIAIQPIQKHVAFVQGAIWMLGIVGVLLYGLFEMGILNRFL